MNREKIKPYLYWGVTAVCVIAVSIIIAFLLNRFEVVLSGIKTVARILTPIIYGAALAFLMSPVYDKVSKWAMVTLKRIIKNDITRKKLSRAIASFFCLIFLIALVTLLIWLLIPQIITSLKDVISTLPSEMEKLDSIIRGFLKNNPNFENVLIEQYDNLTDGLSNWFKNSVSPNINKYVVTFYSSIRATISAIFDVIIGLMVMLYLLNMKHTLTGQAKKMCYSIFSVKKANTILEETRYVKSVFSNFIVGKIIDSAIIGVINYFGMLIFRMPYALLISVVVGVTNVIPFFGPFIGAIPSAVILLLVSPIHCLYFLIWILVLQQVDGNIIGPKILGQTTGLPSFWVLFSILLFGGLFGIVGMIIGVPTWAIIYRTVSRNINKSLKNKNLSENSKDYRELDYIEDESHNYVQFNDIDKKI